MGTKVLVLEDEPRVQNFIKLGLEHSGMSVDCVSQLSDLDSVLLTQPYDVVVLDRLIGSEDSIYSLPLLRRRHPKLRVLILSALSEVVERIQGLDYGADDYLGKPFHIEEIVSRIRALTRRPHQAESTKVDYADLHIDLETQKISRQSIAVDLTAKEFKLLVTMASRPGKIFSRSELLQRAWDMSFDPESNVVDVAIGRLKRKVNLDGLPKLIHAKRGGGYYLSSEETTS